MGSAGPQGGPRSGPWLWACHTAVGRSQALPARRLVPVPRFLPGLFFFFFFLNSEVPLSISATGWLVLALTSLLMHPPIQALFPLGSDPGSGALCCGSQQPHSSQQACLGLWTLSLFPACSVTRSWQQPCDADRRAISILETGTLSPELIDLRVVGIPLPCDDTHLPEVCVSEAPSKESDCICPAFITSLG